MCAFLHFKQKDNGYLREGAGDKIGFPLPRFNATISDMFFEYIHVGETHMTHRNSISILPTYTYAWDYLYKFYLPGEIGAKMHKSFQFNRIEREIGRC